MNKPVGKGRKAKDNKLPKPQGENTNDQFWFALWGSSGNILSPLCSISPSKQLLFILKP